MSSSGDIIYEGLIVTTIKVNDTEDKVTFSDSSENGEEAVFLKDIKMNSEGKYEATKVQLDDAKSITARGFGANTSTPLFIVHGFNVEPNKVLTKDYSNFDKDKLYYPVPVLWASEGRTSSYYSDQTKNTIMTGKAMEKLAKSIPNDTFPRKSLVMYSMGNHMVFNGACGSVQPDVQFENIFMVSADVPYDIFHKDPDEGYLLRKKSCGNKRIKADNFFGMLAKNSDGKPRGKIYIVWSKDDIALRLSKYSNLETRIGAVGAGWVDGWFKNSYDDKVIRDEFREYIENFDGTGKDQKTNDRFKHSYQLESWTVDYYGEKSKLIEQE